MMDYYPRKNWKLKFCEPDLYDIDTAPVITWNVPMGFGSITKSKERIVFDGNYTIYYDRFGEKTIVHKMENEPYDAEKAVLYALLKSKGIKPKKVQELLASAIDRDVKRKEREAKKEQAKQAAKKSVEIARHNTTTLEEIFKEVLAETLAKYSK